MPDDRSPDRDRRRARRACIVRQVDRVETALVRDAESLVELGFEVDLVVMRIDDDTHWTDLPDGVQVVTLPVRRRRGGIAGYVVDYLVFTLLATAVVAWRHARRRYHVVQVTSLPDLLIVAGLVPRLLGAALVIKVAEPTPQLSATIGHPAWLQRILGRVQIWAARRADHVLTVTDELAADLAGRGVDRDRITVILNVPAPSMLRLTTGARPDPERFVVISHGSVIERYGHDTIVRAVAAARPQIPGLRLVLTGTGPFWPVVESLIDELGIGDVVEHHAWLSLPELVGLLERADVGVVAQRANPYSHLVNTTKMFEFMLLGIPAVCTRLQATESLIDADAGAVRYFESDDAAGLAAILCELASSPEERRRMAKLAGALIEDLDVGTQGRRYQDAIRTASRRRARR